MKKILFSILIMISFVAVSCGNATSSTEQVTGVAYTNVSVTDLNNAISSKEDIIILDVRTPGELNGGYVENALNLDVNGSTYKAQAAKLDKTKTVYVYCRSGHRSQTASKILINMGFTDVRNVEGGFIEWSQKNFKIVK
jgi:rhodanese-related sulfurtransferase